MAIKADESVSSRPRHQPMSKKDMIPTPSQPMKNWNRLLDVTKIIMAIRKISRYLKNLSICGFPIIYQREYCRIFHVMYRAIGMNMAEYWSWMKFILIENKDVPSKVTSHRVCSGNSIEWSRGIKEMKNVIFTVDSVFRMSHVFVDISNEAIIGVARVNNDSRRNMLGRSMNFYLDLHQGWMVSKTNGLLLSFKSEGAEGIILRYRN